MKKEKQMYSVLQNYGYLFRLLKQLSGTKYIILCFGQGICVLLGTFLAMALPSVVVELFGIEASAEKRLLLLMGYVVVLLAIQFITAHVKDRQSKSAFLLRVRLGGRVFAKKCLEMDYQTFESKHGQEMCSAAQQNIYCSNNVGIEAFLQAFVEFLPNAAGILIYAFIIGYNSLMLLLFLVALTTIVAIVNYRAGKKSYQIGTEMLDQDLAEYSYLSNETMNNTNGKDIRMYRMRDWFQQEFREIETRYGKDTEEYHRPFIHAGVAECVLTLLRDGVIYGSYIYQMMQGKLTLSTFLFYIGIVATLSGFVKGAVTQVQEMLKNNLHMNNFREFMEMGVRDEEEKKELATAGKLHEIRLEHVSYRYEDQKEDAIHDVSCVIHRGEKLALVGINGAGKSTLIKLICGLYQPTAGKIFIDGVDLATLKQEEIFREFAMVFQEVFAFSFSLEDNIAGMDAKESAGMDVNGSSNETGQNIDNHAEGNPRLIDVLQRADLWDKVQSLSKGTKTMMNKDLDDEGVTLSGGELQKLMLARALYKEKAPVIILDEPTAALDPIAESMMYERYYELTKEKTSVFISHRLSSTRFCDRILFLEKGQIVEDGSHEQLVQQDGAYARMFAVQSQYYKEGGEANA